MEQFSNQLNQMKDEALRLAAPCFSRIDDIARENTLKILDVFRRHRVSDYDFQPTSGYAYGDVGREKLDAVLAEVFGAESALVRVHFASGTHALASVLFGILRPGDELLSITGAPYDTMQTVIGHAVFTPGSLADFGILYKEVAMTEAGVDLTAAAAAISPKTKVILVQRSRGYSLRQTLSTDEIGTIVKKIKQIKSDCIIFVDNCYGEFTEISEPPVVGADIIAGSLIKNPGGGLAPSGGYITGRSDLVKLAAYRLTAPGLGGELGASLAGNRLLYQGLFLAPHTTAQALKGAVFAAALFTLMGYEVFPRYDVPRSDIIQAISLGTSEKLIAFCQGLQRYSPVNAHVRPEPAPMPGYADEIIMAAGTFVQGASIEISADGPLRPPYAAYLQGALTFEHAVVAVMGAAAAVLQTDSRR